MVGIPHRRLIMHIQDYKQQALIGEGYIGRHVDDLVAKWLRDVIITSNGKHLVDLWGQFLNEVPVPAGSLNDRWGAWLSSLGHTGTLNDKWHSYWKTRFEALP